MVGKEKKILVEWLKDAYAMENSIMETLEGHADDAKHHRRLQSKILEHVYKTRDHALALKNRLRDMGEPMVGTTITTAHMLGKLQSISPMLVDDVLVRNSLAEYATEYYEIGTYRKLILAAESIGDMTTASVCKNILNDELEMADWLDNNLSAVVRHSLRTPIHTSDSYGMEEAIS